MKINLKRNPKGVNECFYEELESLIAEYSKLESTCDHIVDMSSPYQMRRYIRILLENITDLQHYKSSTLGLWATDRVDKIIDDENVLFELIDSKEINMLESQ